MKIGKSCFLEKQIQDQIISNKREGICNILGITEEVYDTAIDTYLKDSFIELLDSFSIVDKDFKLSFLKPKKLIDYLRDWNIFSNNENVDIILILKSICPCYCKDNPLILTDEVYVNGLQTDEDYYKLSPLTKGTWNEFCSNIKHTNRFHSNYINLQKFRALIEDSMSIEIEKGVLRLKRARICDEKHYDNGYDCTELGAPPEHCATAGRANSEGISCLYLADTIETTLYETRARDNDRLSIGTFEQIDNLCLVDFASLDSFSPMSADDFQLDAFAANINFIKQIVNEVAKPLRRFDKTLDYLPTQYICDFIKFSGFDGIKYKSTLSPNGINYAIFNSKKFKCIDVVNVCIKNMNFEWEVLK